LYCVW